MTYIYVNELPFPHGKLTTTGKKHSLTSSVKQIRFYISNLQRKFNSWAAFHISPPPNLTPSEDIPPPCQLLMICSPWTMIITITKCPTLRRVKITNPVCANISLIKVRVLR
ncbi:MAG: hypothetical protein ACTS5A_02095 [Candidatus Hodgkinia cicadicola]